MIVRKNNVICYIMTEYSRQRKKSMNVIESFSLFFFVF